MDFDCDNSGSLGIIRKINVIGVEFYKHEVIEGTVTYYVKVEGDDGITFEFKDRYKNMRKLYESLKKLTLPNHIKKVLIFPRKKLINATGSKFLSERQSGLQ